MKKILIISNEFGFTQNVIRFAVEVARADASLLHSIFMRPLHQQEELSYLFPNDYRLSGKNITGDTYEQEDQRLIEVNIQYFKDECTAAGVPYGVDVQQQTTLKDLIEQSYFADLIITDADADMGPYQLKDLLTDAHCSMCLIPRRAHPVEQVVLCYDGSDSSIYALKQYSYLFPQWSGKPTTLLTVNSNQMAGGGEVYLSNWLSQHFPGAKRELLAGNASKELVHYVSGLGPGTLVVLGAYSRGALSRLMHQSTADTLLQQTGATLFVAHL
jgi:hypothetical protein